MEEILELGIKAVQRARFDNKELTRCAEAFLREGLLYDVSGQDEEELMIMAMMSVFLMVKNDLGKTIIAEGLTHKRIRVEKYDDDHLILSYR